jgi:cysteine desulfurase
MKLPVYLDNHATTRVDQRVVDVMTPLMTEEYGNAASRQHEYGWRAEAAVEIARSHVAALIGAQLQEIVFTSGATESINLALKGVADAAGRIGDRIVVAATEHRAVLEVCEGLRQRGFAITVLPVDGNGMIDPDELRRVLDQPTLLVSIMAANNEIGTIAPLAEIGAICRERKVLFHTDAAQAAGKIPIDVRGMNIDLLSLSAHKIYGPKGVGALYIRSGKPMVRILPQMAGGGHEKGMRSGTLNVPGIAGLGEAARIAVKVREEESKRVQSLRDRLIEGLSREIEGLRVNGHPTERLVQNANVQVAGVPADQLMMAMKDVAVSAGSACSSASPEPSHVLKAIGLSQTDASCCIRFGLGRFTTEEEVEYAIRRTVEAANSLAKKHAALQG